MPLTEAQVRIVVSVWSIASNVVYDVDYVVRRLTEITNPAALGGEIATVVADALNEGYLYVDQIKSFNAFSGLRAFAGLTPSGRLYWALVYPTLAANEGG